MHSKLKSGADFPVYMQELHVLGVTHYETYVYDGHSNYYGKENDALFGSKKRKVYRFQKSQTKNSWYKPGG